MKESLGHLRTVEFRIQLLARNLIEQLLMGSSSGQRLTGGFPGQQPAVCRVERWPRAEESAELLLKEESTEQLLIEKSKDQLVTGKPTEHQLIVNFPGWRLVG
jgi:hypothetical protein